MPEYDGSIRIGTQISTKDAEKELNGLSVGIAKTAEEISSLRSKMNSLKDVRIPTQAYKDIQTQIATTEAKIADLGTKQEKFLATGGSTESSAYKRMQYDLDELRQSLPYLNDELQDLVETGKAFTLGKDTDEYSKMSAQMQQLNQKMQSDLQRQYELQSVLNMESQRLADIKKNATVSDQGIIEALERRKRLQQEINDLEKAGVGLGYKEHDDKVKELDKLNSAINDYKKNLSNVPQQFERMKTSAKKAFTSVRGETKKSEGVISSFSSRIKGIAVSAFIYNGISKAFSSMVSGMKTGFENLMGYSNSYANSIQGLKNAMSTLGNQLAAAFAPIVQMVIPWLTALVSAISTAIEYVSRFFAVLTGKSSYTRAKKVQTSYGESLGTTAKKEEAVADAADEAADSTGDMADEIEDSGKEAEKASGSLAAFDDIDVLDKKDSGAGDDAEDKKLKDKADKIKDIKDAIDDLENGAGGGGMDLFEEVPIDNDLPKWLENIIGYLKKLKDIFIDGFWDGLGDWEYRVEGIKESFSSIKDNLIGIFTDPMVLSAADSWAQSFVYMLGSLFGSVASIGLTIADNLLGGIDLFIEENKERIKEHFITMFEIREDINLLLAELFQSIAYVFEAFSSENGKKLTANFIGIFTNAFMGVQEITSKAARDILNIFIKPFTDNKEDFRTALEGFLGVLSEVAGTIKRTIDETFANFNSMYDEHLKPFFDSVAQGLSDLVGEFMDFWNGTVQPILERWAEKFDDLFQNHIQPMINKGIELFGKIGDCLKTLWENVVKPFISWIIKNVLPVIAPILEGVGNAVMTVYGVISDVIGNILYALGGVVDFITGVFSGDWEKAWNGIVETFRGIFNIIPTIIEGIINKAIDIINGIIGGINNISGKIGIPAIPEIERVSIPRLATGAVIRGGNPFMAILGDQPAGKVNIEAPADLIKEMARQGIREELSTTNLSGIGGGTLQVTLNVNGEELARATLNDWLSEANRQGYDVSVLGVT